MVMARLHGADGKTAPPPTTRPFLGAGSPHDVAFVAEGDHRIANHLALLAGYVRLKAADLGQQDAEPNRAQMLLLLQGLAAQIGAISRLHRVLSRDDFGASAHLDELLHEICASFTAGLSGGIKLTEDFAPDCVLRPDQTMAVGRIVSEAITNAVKYGGDGEFILVRCALDNAGSVVIEVIDHGPGLPETFDPSADGGLGFRLLRGLAKKLSGTLHFQSIGHGLRFSLVLPPQGDPAMTPNKFRGPARRRP
jgi:two-component sensor histidine kinase